MIPIIKRRARIFAFCSSFTIAFGVIFMFVFTGIASAQSVDSASASTVATTTAMGTSSPLFGRTAETLLTKKDVTIPEEEAKKKEVLSFFEKRQASELTATNIFAYAVQKAVENGMPANTVILILLLPLLATLIVAVRLVVGLPTLEMLVPIALAVTLIASGVLSGLVILATILIASFLSRILLRKLRIMQQPKMALSLLIVSFCVFGVLGMSAVTGLIKVEQLSIFPVLILILLSDKIFAVHLQRSVMETIFIALVTIALGATGFLLLTWEWLRNGVLLYPEALLLLIPINIAIGRYLGLRITEHFRFASLKNDNKLKKT